MKTSARMLCGALLVSAASLPASAQFYDGTSEVTGTCHQRYKLKDGSTLLGHLVVVAHGCTSQPAGFAAGEEHWGWLGTPWPDDFDAVPSTNGPAYGDLTWGVFDLDHFDLDTTITMPTITLGTNDSLYEVSITWDDSEDTQAIMWLQDGFPDLQVWYAYDGALQHDLVGVDADAILFRSISSVTPQDVHPLCSGPCN